MKTKYSLHGSDGWPVTAEVVALKAVAALLLKGCASNSLSALVLNFILAWTEIAERLMRELQHK